MNQCEGKIRRGKGYHIRWEQCKSNASVEEGGKHYCKTHAPSFQRARQAKRNADYKASFEYRQQLQHQAHHRMYMFEPLLTTLKEIQPTLPSDLQAKVAGVIAEAEKIK